MTWQRRQGSGLTVRLRRGHSHLDDRSSGREQAELPAELWASLLVPHGDVLGSGSPCPPSVNALLGVRRHTHTRALCAVAFHKDQRFKKRACCISIHPALPGDNPACFRTTFISRAQCGRCRCGEHPRLGKGLASPGCCINYLCDQKLCFCLPL